MGRDIPDEEDWPVPSGSWRDALEKLEVEVNALEQAILRFPDERLQEPAPAKELQTFYILLHGVVQHTLYHAGQIIVLNK
jgi:DinB superfamily